MSRLRPTALPCPKCKARKDDPCVSLPGGKGKAGEARSRPHDERIQQLPKVKALCGTYSGHQRHKRIGEESCAPCKRAAASYMATYRATRPADYAEELRVARARSRAMTRLAHDYPDVLRKYIAEELVA